MTTKLPTSSKTQEANPDGGRHVFLILGLLAWLILLTSSPAVLAKEHWTDSCLQSPPPELAASSPRGTLVLIIDDLGHGRRTGLSMVALPGKINLAILPHTPHAKELAQAGFAAGKEIMLHVPMSNSGGTLLGPGGLTPSLSREEFDRTLTESIDAIPHVRGINNHMGSELTTLPLQMGWVMQALIRRGLYFVDSRTNARTVAAKTAGNYNVPHLSRSIFLDNEISEVAITSQFNHLVKRAEQDGLAVGIGHPYPQTASVLAKQLPSLKCRGIELALISEVLQKQRDIPAQSVPAEDDYNQTSEPNFNIPLGHVGFGLGNSVLTEMENTGGKHRIGTPDSDALNQVVEVANAP